MKENIKERTRWRRKAVGQKEVSGRRDVGGRNKWERGVEHKIFEEMSFNKSTPQ